MNKIFPSPYSDLSIHMLRNIHTKCIFITLPHTCWVLYICSLFANINPLHINYGYCAKLCCCFCLANHCHKYVHTHTYTHSPRIAPTARGGWMVWVVGFVWNFSNTQSSSTLNFSYFVPANTTFRQFIPIIIWSSSSPCRQTDSQPNTGENPILKHNHHHHHRIMLEPIHSMNVPVRPFVLNPKTKRGLQYWQTLIREGLFAKARVKRTEFGERRGVPTQPLFIHGWVASFGGWNAHTHDIHRILANMNI